MKIISGFIDGLPIKLNVPETLTEYREGARTNKGLLNYNEGFLFDFGKSMNIVMENSGVHHDLVILYFNNFNKYGIVEDLAYMDKNSSKQISSVGYCSIAVEFRKDFVDSNRIKKGSVIVLTESLKP
jgi:uncharacterized membrane protein (UPF0127 family)